MRVLLASRELFKQFGVKAVTMDQVRQRCGISKKTLYKYVDNKADLVRQVFSSAVEELFTAMNELFDASTPGNAIDKLFALERFAEQHLRGEEDRILEQLVQYYPEIAVEVKNARQRMVATFTRANLEEGIAEGLYREDLNIEYITILYYGHILAVHESVIGGDVDFNELRKASLRYHIRGIASAKGLHYLNELLKQPQ